MTYSYPWNYPMYLGGNGASASPTFRSVTPTAAAVGSRIPSVSLADPFESLQNRFGKLSEVNGLLGENIYSGLKGELSPSTVRAIQDYAATRGIAGGMPGANIFENLGAAAIGKTAEGLQQQALQNYASIIPAIYQTQTNAPGLQYQVDYQNAVNKAAPDPSAAASYAQQLYSNYLQAVQSPAGGSGGYSIQAPRTLTASGPMGTGGYRFGDRFNLYGNRDNSSPYTVFSSPSASPWANNDYAGTMNSPSYSPILGEDINARYQGPNYAYGSWLA